MNNQQKNNKNKGVLTILLSLCIALLIITGCAPNYNQPNNQNNIYNNNKGSAVSFSTPLNPSEKIQDKTFASEKELTNFWSTTSASGNSYMYARGGVMMDDVMMVQSEAISSSMPSPSVGKVANDFSFFFNQVASIDEADIFKSDGRYIYTITNNNIFIVNAYPAEDMKTVATIKYDSTSPQEMFIYNDTLVVIGTNYSARTYEGKMAAEMEIMPRYNSYNPAMFIDVYDVSDRTNPKKVKNIEVDGNYFRARMKDNIVYLASTSSPDVEITPYPTWRVNGVEKIMPIDSIRYYPIPYSYPIYAQFSALNLDNLNEDMTSTAIVVEGSQNLYMSENNIYITYTEYINEYEIKQQITIDTVKPLLTESEQALIDKIESTDSEILSTYEKRSKIWTVYERHIMTKNEEERNSLNDKITEKTKAKMEEYDAPVYTIINRVHVEGMKITAEASGMIPGRIINQFSLDEYNEVLRIAATQDQWWGSYGKESWKEQQNAVYTLDMDMKVIGKLGKIAPNERIYSTRFIGDRLYMVTFKQVDPFFVVDLSNPEKIEMLGELKIPGFSRYLHPYDENTIIGIGRDATESGRQEGLKISLFDVTDVSNPKEIAKYVGSDKYAQSSAEYEHRAFLFSKEKNLLVIPAYNYDYERQDHNYNGALVYDISKEGIDLRGLINHANNNDGGYYYQPSVERSAYINDVLYTKSPYLLRANDLKDLESISNVTLTTDATGPIPIY